MQKIDVTLVNLIVRTVAGNEDAFRELYALLDNPSVLTQRNLLLQALP